MALQDILTKILAKADEEVQAIQADFEAKKKALESEFAAKEQQDLEALNVRTEEALGAVEEKIKSMARRENSKVLLGTKRKLVQTVLQKFETSLEEADDAFYEKVLVKLFDSVADTEGTVLTPSNRLAVTKKVAPKGFEVKADESIKGGFILKCKNGEIDNSFKNLVQSEYKSELEMYFVEHLKLV